MAFLSLVIVIGAIVIDVATPATPITPDQISQHVDEKVSVKLTLTQKIEQGTKLDFMMPVYISTYNSKTESYSSILIFLPIMEKYGVYDTKEGILVAIDKKNAMTTPQTCQVTGWVRKEKGSSRYAIEVSG